MQRPMISSLRWLTGVALCAVTLTAYCDEPVADHQLAADAIQAGRSKDCSAITKLAEQLSHESVLVRQASAWALTEFGSAASDEAPALTNALGDLDARVRWGAATSLGKIGRPAGIAELALWKAALDRDIDVRCAALIALRAASATHHVAALPTLMECLRSPSADVQAEAIATISTLHSRWDENQIREIAPQLATVIETSHSDLRLAAAVLLGNLGLPAAEGIVTLTYATDDVDECVQAAALRAIGQFAAEAERRWPQFDTNQRDALLPACEAIAKNLRPRVSDSAKIAQLVEQIHRLTLDQPTPSETAIVLPTIENSDPNATLTSNPTKRQVTTPTSHNRWAWSFAVTVAGICLWGLRRRLSRGATSDEFTSKSAQPATAASNELPSYEVSIDDTATRRDRINALSDVALEAAASLHRAMNDIDPVVRWRSASAVTAVHSATVSRLLAAVTSSDPEVRRLAMTSMRGLGANISSSIAHGLQDEDARIRQAAAMTLGEIGPGAIDTVPQLASALVDEDPKVRAAAAQALTSFGPHAVDTTYALRMALFDNCTAARTYADKNLGTIEPSELPVPTHFRRLVSGPDVPVRENVVSVLGGIGTDTTVVLPSFQHAVCAVESEIMTVASPSQNAPLELNSDLPRHFEPVTMDRVEEISESEKFERVKESSPQPVLLPLRPLALQAIHLQGPVESPTKQDRPVLKVFNPEPIETPKPVIATTESLGPVDFIARLEDTDADVRWRASQCLEHLGTSAVPEMIAALNHRNPGVRRLLVVALGRIGHAARDSMPAMLIALHDVNADVRCAAADALGQLGVVNRSMIQSLVQSLTDSNSEVRRYAATTLGRFGTQARDAKVALQISSISDMAAKVRKAAQTALKRITESLVEAA